MKTELTMIQSSALIQRGIPATKASSYGINGSTSLTGIGGDTLTKFPVFTLADLLGILPKRIKKNDAYLTLIADYNDWSAAYEYYDLLSGGMDAVYSVSAPELIDSLYELTIWLIENKYLQL